MGALTIINKTISIILIEDICGLWDNFNKFVMFFDWSNGTCLLLVKIDNECEMYCSTEVFSDTLSLLWTGWILGIYSNSKSSVSLKLFTRSIVDECIVVSIPLQLPLWYSYKASFKFTTPLLHRQSICGKIVYPFFDNDMVL